jgi:prepilin-type N-terminal cleavage/methylation domain-containing protein
MKKLMPKPRGFTIIEVIIVLVIGATIMIAVFVVVPQLQQSARNNQRRRDAQRVLTAVRQYYSQISFPAEATTITNIVQGIVGSPFNDPNLKQNPDSSNSYTIKARTNGIIPGVVTWIDVNYNYKCKSNQSTELEANLVPASGSFAVTVALEPIEPTLNSGNYTSRNHYCIND